ncbi:serine/threonine-protein kinase [Streptomyces sp. NPDC017979]|uniref:serine/threonine-protein kinase n=1 Tax=Streptomyces sp. NPDC017979 TaxID=3365024 RepID=UPI0037B83647
MTNDGGRATEPTSYVLKPPKASQVPAQATGTPAPPQEPAAQHEPPPEARPAPAPSPAEPGPAAPGPVVADTALASRASDAAGSGRLIGGRYRLLGRLGQGGMGTVWQARDEVVDRQVAVKEPRLPDHLSRDERETAHLRMQREARAAARIDHPSVVTIHDVVVEDGQPWIVMELVQGQSLATRLRDGTLDVGEAARIGVDVLGALVAAHAAGVLHRDVKPDNILLGRADRVVLTDFGIAHVEGEQRLTETGGFVGTVEFIAPERALGQAPGPEADLWSLGVVLYAAVEGVSPYLRSNIHATLQAVVSAEPPPPSRGAGAFGTLVMRLLRKEPMMRPDVAEIRQTLESLARPQTSMYELTQVGRAAGGGPQGRGSRWVPPVLHASKKARYGIGGGVLALAAALAVVFVNPFAKEGLPEGWEVRNDREVVSASVAVPSDYRREQDDDGYSVTYRDPSRVFSVFVEKVDTTAFDDEIAPTKEAWQRHYEAGGVDGREIQNVEVTVKETRHQGEPAFDLVVEHLPYSATTKESEDRDRWMERVVSTGAEGKEVYWRVRVAGPADGWAAEEGERIFDIVVENLKIEDL